MFVTSELLEAGRISVQCSAWINWKEKNLDLKTDSWSELYVAMSSRHHKVGLEKSVMVNSWISTAGWLKNVESGCRHIPCFCRAAKWTCSELCTSELPTCMWYTAELAANEATTWHMLSLMCRPWSTIWVALCCTRCSSWMIYFSPFGS